MCVDIVGPHNSFLGIVWNLASLEGGEAVYVKGVWFASSMMQENFACFCTVIQQMTNYCR